MMHRVQLIWVGVSSFISRNSKIIHYSLLTIIFLIGILLRVDALSKNDFHSPDSNRDYLISEHTIKYGEIPLTGPGSPLGRGINSPFYYYFLSLVLLIQDSVTSLHYFNFFLQILTILLIYSLSRTLFDKTTALVATLFWSVSELITYQSGFLWQPHIMQPFAILSYLLLALGWSRKNYALIVASIAIITFASVVHVALFFVLPVFMALVALALWQMKMQMKHYALAGITAVGSLFAFYLPLIVHRLSSISQHNDFILHWGREDMVASVLKRLSVLGESLFMNPDTLTGLFITIFIAILGIAYIAKHEDKRRQTNFYILLSTITLFVALSPLINVEETIFPSRYFTPIFGLCLILLAELITKPLSSNSTGKVLRIIIITVMIFSFSPNIAITGRILVSKALSPNPMETIYVPFKEKPSSELIKNAVLEIKEKENKQNLYFFQIRSYRGEIVDNYADEPFWVSLEKMLDQKLVSIDDSQFRGYKPLGTDEYIILKCGYNIDPETAACARKFAEENNYKLLRLIASESDPNQARYNVYLLVRNKP